MPKFVRATQSQHRISAKIGSGGVSYSPGYLPSYNPLNLPKIIKNHPDRSFILKNLFFSLGLITVGISIGLGMTANPVYSVITTASAGALFAIAGFFADRYISRVNKFMETNLEEAGDFYGVSSEGDKNDIEKKIEKISFAK